MSGESSNRGLWRNNSRRDQEEDLEEQNRRNRSPSPRGRNFLNYPPPPDLRDGGVQDQSQPERMQAAMRASRLIGWRIGQGINEDQQEQFQDHSGIPDISIDTDAYRHADASNTRSDNAELGQPQDHLIRVLRNERLRNRFIRTLQNERSRNRFLARLPSSWAEFNERARNVLNNNRLRNNFISTIQNARLRNRFIRLLQLLQSREGSRTPSLVSDNGTDDTGSSISTSFDDEAVRSFSEVFEEPNDHDDDDDHEFNLNPDRDGVRP